MNIHYEEQEMENSFKRPILVIQKPVMIEEYWG